MHFQMENIVSRHFSVFLAVNTSDPVSQLQVLETRAHCEHFIAEGIDISTKIDLRVSLHFTFI